MKSLFLFTALHSASSPVSLDIFMDELDLDGMSVDLTPAEWCAFEEQKDGLAHCARNHWP